MKMTSRHLSAFIAPLLLGFVLPYFLIRSGQGNKASLVLNPQAELSIAGALLSLIGLAGFILVVQFFIRLGDGTIMPWDPTRRLITAGIYGHTRNPMILSLIVLQLGEALLFGSLGVLLLALVNFIVNNLYFFLSEEPGLEKRFGQEYLVYRRNVPRWLPRLKPWIPGKTKLD